MRICKVENCNLKHHANGFCSKHYIFHKRNGFIVKRTTQDLNEIVIKEDHAEVILQNRRYEEIARVIIDLDQVEKVSKYRWSLSNDYAINHEIGLMHRYIMNMEDNEMFVDHINNTPLDNRKINLRECTNAENSRNSKLNKNNKSGVTGVYFLNREQKWVATIKVNYKKIFLGSFKDIEQAIEVRRKAEIKHFKEFRYGND